VNFPNVSSDDCTLDNRGIWYCLDAKQIRTARDGVRTAYMEGFVSELCRNKRPSHYRISHEGYRSNT